jgi:hypothetical protein
MMGLKKLTRSSFRKSISITPNAMADLPAPAWVAVMYKPLDIKFSPKMLVCYSGRKERFIESLRIVTLQ